MATTLDDELWWEASAGRYFRYTPSAEGASEAEDGVASISEQAEGRGELSDVISLGGTRRVVPRAALQELGEDAVLSELVPLASEAIERIGATLGRLDPAFAGLSDLEGFIRRGGAVADLRAAIERVPARLASDPELLPEVTASIVADVEILHRILGFGQVARPVLTALGIPPSAHDTQLEPADAMIARVRASVRAELDAHAAERKPISFDFDDLVRGSR